jgi:hypothetical protein
MQTYRILRKNGPSVEVNIPIEFARALRLSPGDLVLMSAGADTVTITLKKWSDAPPQELPQEQRVDPP